MKVGVISTSIVCCLLLSAATQASLLLDEFSTGQVLLQRVMPDDVGIPIVSSSHSQAFSGVSIDHTRMICFASYAPTVGAGINFCNFGAVTMFVDGSTVALPPGANRSTQPTK